MLFLKQYSKILRVLCVPKLSYEDARFIVSTLFSLGIKYKLKPLQANVRVSESRVGARIDPTRSGICSPVSSIG